MPQHKKRHDAYGRPLPSLASVPDPEHRAGTQGHSVLDNAQNTRMRAYLLWLLEEGYADLFRLGTWADVSLALTVSDGTLRPEIEVIIRRHHHPLAEER